MMDFFSTARESDPSTFVMVLTQRDKEKVGRSLLARGFEQDDFIVDSVAPDRVPEYLSAADISVSFIKPCFSKLSSSPTKLAEYLACGLPIISNMKIGDVDALIQENNVGVLIPELNEQQYSEALHRVNQLGDLSEHCKAVSREEFDLASVGGDRYRRLYRRMSESSLINRK
jgi:glycosyltransferase involved in cell wall biosynthesis